MTTINTFTITLKKGEEVQTFSIPTTVGIDDFLQGERPIILGISTKRETIDQDFYTCSPR